MSKQLVLQHIVFLVQRLRNSNVKQQNHIINSLNNAAMQESITFIPVWATQITQQRLWQVHKVLVAQSQKLQLSLQLLNKKWLNLNVNLMPGHSSLMIFILCLEVGFFILMLFIVWLLYHYSIPLQTLREAAEEIGFNIHSAPLQSTGPEVARETYNAFNAMQNKIQLLLKERSLMLAAIAHDLKTPLTRMQLRTDFIADKEQYQNNMADIDSMNILVEQVVAYAEEESEVADVTRVDVNALVESLCHDYQDQQQAVNLNLRQEHVLMQANSVSLKRLCSNLIENAIKYAGSVDITLDADVDNIILIFDDAGPGLSSDKIKYITQAFYRVDKARNQNISGSGLGLAIVAKIVQTYRGYLTIKNRTPTGLQVKITLPKI